MRLGHWRFKPGWAATSVVLVLLPTLLALGFWQLERARQKAEWQAAFAARSIQPTLPLAEVDVADPANRYRRVSVTGHYDAAHHLLLDNQLRAGQPGYHVLTPLRLAAGDAILVNRGWIALGASRQAAPELTTPTDRVTVQGWLGQPTNPGLRLGAELEPTPHGPWVVLAVDYAQAAAWLGYALRPALILLEPDAPGGYLREWQPRFGGFGPERHYGYAVQWFGLAATLLALFIAAHTRRASPTAPERR